MEAQREDIVLQIEFVRHDRMRLGFERRLDDTAACIPRFEEQVAVAHPVPFPEVLAQVLRNGGMLSGIQSGLGLFSRAKPGREQRFAQPRDVGHVRAAQNGSSRRDEISGTWPHLVVGRGPKITQIVIHRLVDEREQNVVSLGLNKPAQREEFYPARPPGGDQCDHLVSGDRLQLRISCGK